jgi:thiosulfate/3-mercaptopyruvate sulfurtransferase
MVLDLFFLVTVSATMNSCSKSAVSLLWKPKYHSRFLHPLLRGQSSARQYYRTASFLNTNGWQQQSQTKPTHHKRINDCSNSPHSLLFSSISAVSDVFQQKQSLELSINDAIKVHDAANVKILDGSWFMPNSGKNGREAFITGPRIVGAKFFDIEDIVLPSQDNPQQLPHMMSPPSVFAAAMDELGIRDTDHIIIYGQHDCPFIFRAWYQIQSCGHPIHQTHLLGGSLQKWIDAGGPVDDTPLPSNALFRMEDIMQRNRSIPSYQPKYQLARSAADRLMSLSQMKEYVQRLQHNQSHEPLLFDTRSPERFAGTGPEPRAGFRSGHMPGAVNLYFMELLDPVDKTQLLPTDALKARLEQAGLTDAVASSGKAPAVVSSCGSGVTACTIAAAVQKVYPHWPPESVVVYDGSWSEWGSLPDTAIVSESK